LAKHFSHFPNIKNMTHNLFNTRQTLKPERAQTERLIRCRNLKNRESAMFRVSRFRAHRARIVLRNFDEGKKISEESVKVYRELGGDGGKNRRSSVRRRARYFAGFYRRSAARGLAAMRSAVERMAETCELSSRSCRLIS
jgi:hypothetical protein